MAETSSIRRVEDLLEILEMSSVDVRYDERTCVVSSLVLCQLVLSEFSSG